MRRTKALDNDLHTSKGLGGSQLELREIAKSFGNTAAVNGIDLLVNRREFLTVLGPSGCGKTTLLRMIGGFIEPDRGQILIDESDVRGVPVEHRPTAMLFQGYSLWPHLTVARNVSFGLELRRAPKEAISKRVDSLLELVGLAGYERRLPSELSGGQQQRVALARALSLEPRILLLDEPFSSLDLKLRIELRGAVREIQQVVGTTTILVTHDQDEALELSDSIVVMNEGLIEQIGTPSEIYNEPRTRFVANFIGTMNFLEATRSTAGVRLASGTEIPVRDQPSAEEITGPQVIGVRPEDVIVSGDATIGATARVLAVRLRGHYHELELHIGTESVRAFVPKDAPVALDAPVGVSFRAIRRFDEAPATSPSGSSDHSSRPGYPPSSRSGAIT